MTTTLSKSGFIGLVREPMNKSPGRSSKRDFESRLDENIEAARDTLAYQVDQ